MEPRAGSVAEAAQWLLRAGLADLRFNFDNSYLALAADLYTELAPIAVASPELVLFNEPLARELELEFDAADFSGNSALLSGNQLPEGARPFAQAYAGHQFGHFTMLGDGRALVLGEHVLADGARFDVQFKGSGRTPYSRQGDGRAALGPMLREYLISEAMHALRVPTTRSLAVVKTGELIFRQEALAGAILTRIAASHIRVGTFAYAAALSKPELLRALVDYTLQRHYPELRKADNTALALLRVVAEKQASLVVDWLRVGFIHGVMNTDNVALSGETIDYGPCAFLDSYDPKTVFSSIDHRGRYCFGNQPAIAQWNLARFAESLLPALHQDKDRALELAREIVDGFAELFQGQYLAMMRAKLGLASARAEDQELVDDFLHLLQKHKADYTNSFLSLAATELLPPFDNCQLQNWRQRWQQRVASDDGGLAEAKRIMRANNPLVVPRNHMVERALAAAVAGDMRDYQGLLAALQSPYQAHAEHHHYQQPAPASFSGYQTFCGT